LVFPKRLLSRSNRRPLGAVAVVCLAAVAGGCARLPLGRGAFGPGEKRLTSFDDLMPGGICSVVYLPDLPRTKAKFAETELSRRLAGQRARGLWRKLDFVKPWAALLFEQVFDQVDELVWGTYRGERGREWFVVARINQPSRRVLGRLHKRLMPRVAEEMPSLRLVRSRICGRRIYEWVKGEGPAGRCVAAYTFLGKTMVAASDCAFVRKTACARPFRPWGRAFAPRRPPVGGGENFREAMAGFRPGDDIYAWAAMGCEGARGSGGGEAGAAARRMGDRIAASVARQVEAASVGLRIVPPDLTGRWSLRLRRAPAAKTDSPSGAFRFSTVVPRSARTMLAIYGLPVDHPLFDEFRRAVGEVFSAGPLGELRSAARLLGLIPGLGDLGLTIGSLEGRAAYCSFDVEGSERPRRCVLVVLKNPGTVEAAMRRVPLLLRRTIARSQYRGHPILEVRTPSGGAALSVVGEVLVVAGEAEAIRALADAVERGETLDRTEPVRRVAAGGEAGRVLAEFYSAGRAPRAVSPSVERRAGERSPIVSAAEDLLADRRVAELARGRAYSICLQNGRNFEIRTCSPTGFHWSFATVGLAAAMLRVLPAGMLLDERGARTPVGWGRDTQGKLGRREETGAKRPCPDRRIREDPRVSSRSRPRPGVGGFGATRRPRALEAARRG